MSIKWICVPEEYEKNGEKKMAWNRIGKIFTAKSGKEYAKLFTMPAVLLSVFEDKPREQKPQQEYIDVDNQEGDEIPF